MKIISKRRAMKIYHQHPASAFFNTAPADTSGTAVSVITPVGVLAVYAERRQDRNGPYACLMSITLN